MTTGDIDGFIWDYVLQKYMLLEQKWNGENRKKSQDLHLRFLYTILEEAKKGERFRNWKFGVYMIIGNPPFHESIIVSYPNKEKKRIDQNTLKIFMELEIDFEDLPEVL